VTSSDGGSKRPSPPREDDIPLGQRVQIRLDGTLESSGPPEDWTAASNPVYLDLQTSDKNRKEYAKDAELAVNLETWICAPRGRRPKGKIWDAWAGVWVDPSVFGHGQAVESRGPPDTGQPGLELIGEPGHGFSEVTAPFRLGTGQVLEDYDGKNHRKVSVRNQSIPVLATPCCTGIRDSSQQDFCSAEGTKDFCFALPSQPIATPSQTPIAPQVLRPSAQHAHRGVPTLQPFVPFPEASVMPHRRPGSIDIGAVDSAFQSFASAPPVVAPEAEKGAEEANTHVQAPSDSSCDSSSASCLNPDRESEGARNCRENNNESENNSEGSAETDSGTVDCSLLASETGGASGPTSPVLVIAGDAEELPQPEPMNDDTNPDCDKPKGDSDLFDPVIVILNAMPVERQDTKRAGGVASATTATSSVTAFVAALAPVDSSGRANRPHRKRNLDKEATEYIPRQGCHLSLPPGRLACHRHEAQRLAGTEKDDTVLVQTFPTDSRAPQMRKGSATNRAPATHSTLQSSAHMCSD